MDYEKKYSEALKWMRELYPGLHGATKEDAEHFFPELRESEDERIREWLADYFGSIKETVWIHRDITCEQILDWLEKQKEQKSAWSEEDETHLGWIIECLDYWKSRVPDFADKYQSAINWLKSLRPSWKPSEEQMKALEVAFRKDGDDNYRSTINSLYNDLKKL